MSYVQRFSLDYVTCSKKDPPTSYLRKCEDIKMVGRLVANTELHIRGKLEVSLIWRLIPTLPFAVTQV